MCAASLIAAAGLLSGCGGAGTHKGPECADDMSHMLPSAAEAMLGNECSGQNFVPLEDGQHLTLIHGEQGGQHVWMSVLFYSGASSHAKHDIVLEDAGGARIGGTNVEAPACTSGWSLTCHIRVFLDNPGNAEGNAQLKTVMLDGPTAGAGQLGDMHHVVIVDNE